MKLSLEIYHRLPYALKTWVASRHGAKLLAQRYGEDIETRVAEAQARESFSDAEWQAWRGGRLEAILDIASRQVPFYRQYWLERGGRANGAWRELSNWPILEKESVRQNPGAFLNPEYSKRQLVALNTSGTTGTALRLWRDLEANRHWFGLFEARWRRWQGLDFRMPWGIFGGQLVCPLKRRKPPYWVWNRAHRQLYLSTFHISAESALSYNEAMRTHGVEYLIAYPSAIALLANLLAEQRVPGHRLRAVIANAEAVHPDQRQAVAAAFQCPLISTYGMAEAVAAGGECREGRLHAWPDLGWVEADPAPSGDLICTTLINRAMPLIRYRVGDRGVFETHTSPCGCGRRLPAITALEGRNNDYLLTVDGRRVFWLNPVLYELPVRAAQIRQPAREHVLVRVVCGADTDRRALETELGSRLRARLGDVRVSVEYVAEIARTAGGKFKAVVRECD